MYLRSGTPPFSTQRPAPSNFGEWQSVQLWESASASPLLTCAAVNVCSGGRGTSGISIFGVGNGCWPLSLKASSREGPYLDVGVTIMVEGDHSRNAPPQPTGTITYCSPWNLKLTGTALMADPVRVDHSFLPVSAAYAANSPVPWP